MRIKQLLNILHRELSFNVRLIDKYDNLCKQARFIGDIKTAEFYDRQSLRVYEENCRLLIAINEIEKRAS